MPGIVFSTKQAGLAYVRTDIGGIYRTNDAGKQWLPITDWVEPEHGNWLGGESVAPDPVDPNKVYVAAGMYSNNPAAMLRSTDQGRTFQATPVPIHIGGNEDGRGAGERLAVDPNNTNVLYFGSRYDGLWKSVDGSVSWQKVESFPKLPSGIIGDWRHAGYGIGFIIFDPRSGTAQKGSKTIYAGVSQTAAPAALYRSEDAGATWKAVPGLPASLVAIQGGLDSDGSLYITMGNVPGPNNMMAGGVYKLDTATGAWTEITPDKPTADHKFGYAGLSIDRQHAGTLVVTTADRWYPGDDVFRSIDGGKSWKPVKPGIQQDVSMSPYLKWGDPQPKEGWWMAAVAIDPFDSEHVVYGTGATIYGTHDVTNVQAGKPTHWAVEANGIEETAAIALVSPPAGAPLISGLGDVCGFVHDDLAVSPAQGMMSNPICASTHDLDFAANEPAVMVRIGDKGAALSTDGGYQWNPMTRPGPDSTGGSIAIAADASRIVWNTGQDGIVVSADRGKTWQPVKGLSENARIKSDRVSAQTFYALAEGTVYMSTDGGGSFSAISSGLPADASLCVTPGKEGALWVCGNDAGLFRGVEGNKRFEKVGGVGYAKHLGFGKSAPGKSDPALYLAGAAGARQAIYRSDDGGSTWLRLNDDAHQYGWLPDAIAGDPRIYGRVYLGNNGRGVIYGQPTKTGQ